MEEKNGSPKVSVIIPTYNRRDWIGECLDSVLGQTYKNIEIIVVDDRSTDTTIEWLRSEKKYHSVRLHVQQVNGGASTARNVGIEMATGDLIVFIDSDDTLRPNHVETAVNCFEENASLGLFCCDSIMIDVHGKVILDGVTWHENLASIKGVQVKTGFRSLTDVFAYSNCFPGFTLRRDLLRELGGFDQGIFPADDYDLALRVAGSDFEVFYLHKPLCLRREHDGQCSGIRNSVKTQVEIIRALERATQRNPDKLDNRSGLVRRRLAEARFDLGISEIKEGRRTAGVRNVLRSLLSDPFQMRTVVGIARRRLQRINRTNAEH
jgi:glycosyltransferase involved in cell wall biosynthesis